MTRAAPAHAINLRLALIRHTAPLIRAGVCYGRTDVAAVPFDASLDAIVAAVVAFGPTRLVSSPLRRCRVLADELAPASNGATTFDNRLCELDFGAWEGRPWDDVPRPDLDRWAADPLGFTPPGGESGTALIGRVTAAFTDIARVGGRVAVVSHAGPLRVLAALARGVAVDLLQPGPAFGSVDVIAISPPNVRTRAVRCS